MRERSTYQDSTDCLMCMFTFCDRWVVDRRVAPEVGQLTWKAQGPCESL